MRELRHRLTRSIDATGLRRTKMAMITERSTKEPLLKVRRIGHGTLGVVDLAKRSEEHTSELQSLMRISYDVFCLKKTNSSHKTTKVSAFITTQESTTQ